MFGYLVSGWMNELLPIPDEKNVITESSCILAGFDIIESLGCNDLRLPIKEN